MSNIGWHRLNSSPTVAPDNPAIRGPVEKLPYTAKQRIKEDMTPAQKQGVVQWNTMIDTLQKHGLMESKGEA